MPVLYPPIVTLPVDASVAAFLASATRVTAAVDEMTRQRFVADALFAPGPNASAVVYDQILTGGSFLATDVEEIRPGAAFPRLAHNLAGPLAAAAAKYGGEVPITWEERDDNRTDILKQRTGQLANTILRKVDGIAMAALAAAPTNTLAAGTAWSG